MKIAVVTREQFYCLSDSELLLSAARYVDRWWWTHLRHLWRDLGRLPAFEDVRPALEARCLVRPRPWTVPAVLCQGIGQTVWDGANLVRTTGRGHLWASCPWTPGEPVPEDFAGHIWTTEKLHAQWRQRFAIELEHTGVLDDARRGY